MKSLLNYKQIHELNFTLSISIIEVYEDLCFKCVQYEVNINNSFGNYYKEE